MDSVFCIEWLIVFKSVKSPQWFGVVWTGLRFSEYNQNRGLKEQNKPVANNLRPTATHKHTYMTTLYHSLKQQSHRQVS